MLMIVTFFVVNYFLTVYPLLHLAISIVYSLHLLYITISMIYQLFITIGIYLYYLARNFNSLSVLLLALVTFS